MNNIQHESQASWYDTGLVKENLRKRRAAEARFKWIGRAAIGLAMSFLAVLFLSVFSKGIPGFFQIYVTLEVYLAAERIDPDGDAGVNSLFLGMQRA